MNKPTLDALPTYQHTQRGPWSFVLLAVVASNLTLAVRLWGNEPAWASWLFLSVALLMTFMTLCFQSLTTTVSETSLRVHFGPIPLLEKRFCWKRLFPFAQKKAACSMAGECIGPLAKVGFTTCGVSTALQSIWVQDISEWEPTTRTSSAKSWKEPYRHLSRKPWTDRKLAMTPD